MVLQILVLASLRFNRGKNTEESSPQWHSQEGAEDTSRRRNLQDSRPGKKRLALGILEYFSVPREEHLPQSTCIYFFTRSRAKCKDGAKAKAKVKTAADWTDLQSRTSTVTRSGRTIA